jgi:hypothetical protein
MRAAAGMAQLEYQSSRLQFVHDAFIIDSGDPTNFF